MFRVASRHTRWDGESDPEEFTYAVCSGCSLPLLLRREFDEESNAFETSRYVLEFPFDARRITFAVPRHVRHSYDEAVRCEEATAWTAVATMAGRALEAICLDFDPSSRSIHDGLKKMLDAGAISEELRTWGDGLRIVRNEGAHAGDRVSARDARYALDFLQALMEIIYDLRVRFDEWQQERAARAAARANRRSAAATPTSDGGSPSEAGPPDGAE